MPVVAFKISVAKFSFYFGHWKALQNWLSPHLPNLGFTSLIKYVNIYEQIQFLTSIQLRLAKLLYDF